MGKVVIIAIIAWIATAWPAAWTPFIILMAGSAIFLATAIRRVSDAELRKIEKLSLPSE